MAHGTHRFPLALVVAALLVAPVARDVRLSAARSAEGATIVVNEVQYDPEPAARESGYEWVELWNGGLATVSLAGWRIADNHSSDPLPDVELSPGEFLVVAGSEAFGELFPDFHGRFVALGGSIGNGLGNSGDRVMLLDPNGTMVDGMSYGSDASVLDPPVGLVAAGHSLERVPAGTDTDSSSDWMDQQRPSPGAPAEQTRPTSAPTPAPPATLAPGAAAVLNEYLPAPRDVDWDGDGTATASDEWVELFNPGTAEVNLRGWQLDDVAEGGSKPFVFTADVLLAPGGHLLLFQRETGVVLNNGGDSVRLLRPDGSVADETSYARSRPDQSLARDGDGSGAWTDQLPPSPGRPNPRSGGPSPADPTDPAPAPPASATAAPPPATAVPGAPTEDPGREPPTAAPGPTTGPGAAYLPYLISEVLFDPLEAGTDAAFEWVELHNRSDEDATLAGWRIGDRRDWDDLPAVRVPAGGFVVVAASDTVSRSLAAAGARVVVVADGAIGNGLGNRGDVVRLRGPTGQEADAVSYGSNLDAFDPAVPIGPPGWSIERLPPDRDTDSAADWWPQPAPSPGGAGERHTGPAAVRLNEVLPAPRDMDWDGDGTAAHTDEWVELHNASPFTVDLGGWRLQNDGAGHGWTHALPPGTRLEADGYVVLHRRDTRLALVNDGDTVRLLRDDRMVADAFTWTRSPGYDRSWSRTGPGADDWTSAYAVTPGQPNRPLPIAPRAAEAVRPPAAQPPREAAIGDLRGLARRTRVRVRGRLTVPPGPFGPREVYVQDETGGIRVYLRQRDGHFGPAAEGAAVVATGTLADYHGERQLDLADAADLWLDDSLPAAPLQAAAVGTGQLGESTEGLLVTVVGVVTERRGAALVLDDGSGPCRVVVRPATGMPRPRAAVGERLAVTGIAGQYARSAPWLDGHRLMPRWPADLPSAAADRPARLPATGRGP